jgi:hypothetical protein
MTGPFARAVAAMLVAALIGLPSRAAAGTTDPDDRSSGPSTASIPAAPGRAVARDAALAAGPIRASALRWARVESDRLARGSQSHAASSDDKCSASVPEKLAWLYALVGGSILLVYGPQEKDGDVWTMDGKSETVAGAVAIGLSFALLRDIRKKGW